MKQPKAPTRNQKEIMSKYGYDWGEWNVSMEDSTYLVIWNKKKGNQVVINKLEKEKR